MQIFKPLRGVPCVRHMVQLETEKPDPVILTRQGEAIQAYLMTRQFKLDFREWLDDDGMTAVNSQIIPFFLARKFRNYLFNIKKGQVTCRKMAKTSRLQVFDLPSWAIALNFSSRRSMLTMLNR